MVENVNCTSPCDMVVAASCCDDAFVQQDQGNWSELTGSWMELNTEQFRLQIKRHNNNPKIHLKYNELNCCNMKTL